MKYVAFLRGINVGKHRRVTMQELRRAFEAGGYENVSTYIASGNVIFDASSLNTGALAQEVEAALESSLGYHVYVILRSADEIREVVANQPFAGVEDGDEIRLNVTFLDNGARPSPAPAEVSGFRIVGASQRVVFSALDLQEVGTRDVMTVLEKTYGKRITTRSWQVIEAIVARYL